MKEMIADNMCIPKPESLQQQNMRMGEMAVKKQNNDNLVNQLKMIIEEKDKKLKLLEKQINQSLFQECPNCNLTCENASCDSEITTSENCHGGNFSQLSVATSIQSKTTTVYGLESWNDTLNNVSSKYTMSGKKRQATHCSNIYDHSFARSGLTQGYTTTKTTSSK